jgi:DNA helicase-2/ATP-dependent DNA helicase PcrA
MRIGKHLWTSNPVGEKITISALQTPEEEASNVINIIQRHSRLFNDFVILYRVNKQSRVLEEAMRLANIPYTIVGGIRFYERKEIKDILAYLRIIVNPNDSVALQRIINTPRRGIGKTTFQILVKFAKKNNIPVYFALSRVDEIDYLPYKKKKILKEFFILLEKYRKNPEKPAKLISTILEETGYLDAVKAKDVFTAESRIENLQELIKGAEGYEDLESFLERVSLFTEIDEWESTQPRITLMTVHNAKGLEFPIVFVVGLEEGLFPHSKSQYDKFEIEEERRLFHVALTRAKEKVYLSYATGEYGTSTMSRFIKELPADAIEICSSKTTHSLRLDSMV